MNSCAAHRESLVLFVERELGAEEMRQVEEHLAECAACRAEAARIERVRSWLCDPALFAREDASWDDLPERLAARARAETAPRLARPWPRTAWAVGLAASLLAGCALFLAVRRQAPQGTAAGRAPGNEAFVRQIETAYAREATAQYLAECQDLLLNIVRAESGCDGDKLDVSVEVGRARELVRRKRMLDAELRAPAVARARELCDDLESLLVGFSTSERCESPESLRSLERMIEREQLLLRISLLKTELM